MEQNNLRVLFFLTGLGTGGIEKFVEDITQNIRDVQVDIIAFGSPDDVLAYRLNKKTRIIFATGWGKDFLLQLWRTLSNNKYDIVHAHAGCFSYLVLWIAKLKGVKIRIAHAHSADSYKDYKGLKKLIYIGSRICNSIVVTHYFACSDLAGNKTFGKRVVARKNYYRILNPVSGVFFEERKNIKKDLNIQSDEIMVCHVGYFGYHKNQEFILELAQELKYDNYKFVLVGDGDRLCELKHYANDHHINNVIFTGVREDIPDLLYTADIFILPSRLEGLGTVVLEAQACSTPCIVSQNVTKEVDMNLGLVKQVPLDIKCWKEAILSAKKVAKLNSQTVKNAFEKNKTTIDSCVNNIQMIYRRICDK